MRGRHNGFEADDWTQLADVWPMVLAMFGASPGQAVTVIMPCGYRFRFRWAADLPAHDTKCCADGYIVRYRNAPLTVYW